MNNYTISVSIGLLTKEHRQRIGTALWEFLWCLDKITKIDKQGFGWVLGGKPVLLSELAEQLGESEMTVSRNLARLSKEKYIRVIRTPRGLSLRVFKAQKRFNKYVESQEIHPNENVESSNRNVESTNENVESNIDTTVDITVDSTVLAKKSRGAKKPNPYVGELITYFQEKLGTDSLDGSQKENRQYCWLLLQKCKYSHDPPSALNAVKIIIQTALADPFHKKNSTSFKYLFYNAIKIWASAKAKNSTKVAIIR